MSTPSRYIHGTHAEEQQRLTLMNEAINHPALSELHLAGGERILDVGCGLGQFSRAMARAVGPAGCVLGIEYNQEQITEARRQAEAAGEGDLMELRRGDALDPPLAQEEWASFDIVHSRFLLEHLTDPQGAVDCMVRAARRGGRVILQDDDHDVMRFWPAIPRLEAAWHAYAQSYEHLGTDGTIGRKLPELLHRAGAKPTRATWLFYGACAGQPLFEPLAENLLQVLVGARKTIVTHSDLQEQDLDLALEEFCRWRSLDYAALWYAICYAEGVRT